MADNTKASADSNFATDDIGNVHWQYVKLADGTLESVVKSKITTSAAGASDPGLVVRDAGQIATIGGLTEAAPSTDTGSSGLNGRLQRLAQHLTTVTTTYTPFSHRSAASNNATTVKASAGKVGMVTATNTNAAARYLKFYNKASNPAPATDNALIVQRYLIPGSTTGGGTNIPIPVRGLAFSTGIAFAIVTGSSDTDDTGVAAGEIMVNIGYV